MGWFNRAPKPKCLGSGLNSKKSLENHRNARSMGRFSNRQVDWGS